MHEKDLLTFSKQTYEHLASCIVKWTYATTSSVADISAWYACFATDRFFIIDYDSS